MKMRKSTLLMCILGLLFIMYAFTIPNVYASRTVTILLNGELQKEYTTIQSGDILELKAVLEEEGIVEFQWSSDNRDVADVYWEEDTVFLKAGEAGEAVISAVLLTDTGEYMRELVVYTRTDPEQMVYREDEFEQITDEEYALMPRAIGDVTMYINGEIRRTYNTIAVTDTRTATVEVEGETVQKIEWSSNDTGVVTIAGDKDGAVILAVSEGVAAITADITTDMGKRSKDLIISTRTALDMSGVANSNAKMHQAANEESNVNRDINKGDTLKIQGQSGTYYWVSYDDATGFVLKSKVDIPAVSLSLPESVTIHQGESYQLKAQILPEQATYQRVTWSSSNKGVVTVDSEGRITGVKKGSAHVTVRSKDGKLSAGCKIEVENNQVSQAPMVDGVYIISQNTSYNYARMNLKISGIPNQNVTFQLFFDEGQKTIKGKKIKCKTLTETTQKIDGLKHSTTYYVSIKITYTDNGKRGINEYYLGTLKTKKPTVSLNLMKQQKSYVQLKMTPPPSRFYDSISLRCKSKGKKYSSLGKKEFTKKGNLIKINKKLSTSKTYIFEVSLNKKGKTVCKKTISIKLGNTVVNTNIDSNLSKITVSWEKVAFAKGYYIYRSEKKGKLGKKIKTIKKAKTTRYTDLTSRLKNPGKYYYQVCPYWKEGKKKKTGTSNQSGIQARNINESVNNQVIFTEMGLKDLVAGNGQDMNKFRLKSGAIPGIKYQFDGKTLKIHLYIKYSSYKLENEINPTYNDKSTPKFNELSMNLISQKKKGGVPYITLFENGLKKYLHNQLVKGTDNGKNKDFGKSVNFKTALVIHRYDSNEAYETGQQFIEVMLGGINIYWFNSKKRFDADDDPYWYHSQAEIGKVFMPEDYQLAYNKNNGKQNTGTNDGYYATAAHEIGHILGLGDAYKQNNITRCTLNNETCIVIKENGEKIYYNMMIGGDKGFISNDFEMMLQAYKENIGGVVNMQYYKTHGVGDNKAIISDVIGNKYDD